MADIAASVLARLKNKAAKSGRSYQLCLQLFCQEEFLRRLEKSKYAENLVLKGGLFLYKILFVDSSRNREEAFAFQFLIQLLDDLVGVGFGNAQFLCYFLDSHKACVFHFITPFVWL